MLFEYLETFFNSDSWQGSFLKVNGKEDETISVSIGLKYWIALLKAYSLENTI